MGWPLRIQRIPLCIPVGAENGPLYSLDGSCSGAGPTGEDMEYCVSGYYYTLATDPVLFTGAPETIAGPDGQEVINPEHYQGKTFQWISETGLLPLNAGCGGGGAGGLGGMCIAGVSCDYNPDYGYSGPDYETINCGDPGCLIFDGQSFGIEPDEGEEEGAVARIIVFSEGE